MFCYPKLNLNKLGIAEAAKKTNFLDETASLLDISTLLYRLEKMKKQVMLYKEMYQLAKEKKTSRKFILNIILEPGFQIAAILYLSSIELDEKNHDFRQRYTYRVLQTIQMKLILLCVWAEPVQLGSTKTALKFRYEIKIG